MLENLATVDACNVKVAHSQVEDLRAQVRLKVEVAQGDSRSMNDCEDLLEASTERFRILKVCSRVVGVPCPSEEDP